MKEKFFKVFFLLSIVFMMNSCSSNDSETSNIEAQLQSKIEENYIYSDSELEVMKLINDYRISIGLNPLQKISHISFKSEEHDLYMIENNVVNHYDFLSRSENIIKVLGAKSVSENIAYNYNTAKSVLSAWLNSPEHKKNIEGNYTHFGISIRKDSKTGNNYYTIIFAKI